MATTVRTQVVFLRKRFLIFVLYSLTLSVHAQIRSAERDLQLADGFRAHLERTASFYVSGNELMRYGSGGIRQYSSGIHDADASPKAGAHGYCVPDKADAAQLGDVVQKYLEANPAVRHFPGAHLVRQAFRSVWPC